MASNVLGQIAISVSDMAASGAWYEQVLGLVQAGGAKFGGEKVAQVTGVEGSDLDARWLLDQQERFQYELFKVNSPPARPRPSTWRLSDEGYTMIGVHVADFDQAVARACSAGSMPLHPPVGESGARRICVPDPDGNVVELMEDDPRQADQRPRPWAAQAALRFITLVVPNVTSAAAFLTDSLGLSVAHDVNLHDQPHFALWGLAGASRNAILMWAGDILLEIVTYLDPVTRPKPKDYKLTDLGWLNAAFLFNERGHLHAAFERATHLGGKPNHFEIADFGGFAVMYLESPQDFSLEVVQVDEPFMKELGFTPWDSVINAAETVAVPLTVSQTWDRLFCAEPAPALASAVAIGMRPFQTAADGPTVATGNAIEFRNGSEWWIERVLSAAAPSSVTFQNMATDVITRFDLSQAEDGSTLVALRQRAIPGWGDADAGMSARLAQNAQKLSEAIVDRCTCSHPVSI